MAEEGITAVFGPLVEGTHGIVQSICDTLEIPHVEMRWDTSRIQRTSVVNLFPESSLLAQVININDWYIIVFLNNFIRRLTVILLSMKFVDSKSYVFLT